MNAYAHSSNEYNIKAEETMNQIKQKIAIAQLCDAKY